MDIPPKLTLSVSEFKVVTLTNIQNLKVNLYREKGNITMRKRHTRCGTQQQGRELENVSGKKVNLNGCNTFTTVGNKECISLLVSQAISLIW